MVTSNIFLFIPVIAAAWVHEWVYFTIALLASITSPIYHYVVEFYLSKIYLHNTVRAMDWSIALCAYAYMFYYIFTNTAHLFKIPLLLCLTATIIFFWYGFKININKYKKTHPWFHIITSIISGIIVLSK